MVGEGLDSETINDRYQSIVTSQPQWRKRKHKIKQELLGETSDTENEIGPRIRDAIETEKDHDELLQSTISAFDPRGRVCEETGWRILTSEPLVEQNLSNADALIGNPDQNWAIIVECKTGLSTPGRAFEQLFEAAAHVRDYQDYLEEQTGLRIEDLDCVLCVPSQHDRRVARIIEEYERNGDTEELVYIWRLNRFSGETLQLYENIDTRESTETSHNHDLTRLLSGEGIRVAGKSEVTPAFFPSSHLANIIEVAFSEVLWDRQRADKPVTNFMQSELTDVLTSQNNLLHYAGESIGKRIRDEVFPRLLEYGLIEPYNADNDDSDEDLNWNEMEVFEYGVNGRTMETILANLTEEYFEAEVDALAEEKARKQTIEQFHEEVGSFDDVDFKEE
jgi:hypothetical protein